MYKLLIVDDEETILAGMKQIIDWKSYGITQIETAKSFWEAQVRAIDLLPDLCLFDVCIGAEKGYDLINKLKELGIKSQFIMMSGYGEFQYAVEALRCGAREYLLKPVDAEKLRLAVETVITEELGGTLPSSKPSEQDVDPVLHLPYHSYPTLIAKILMIVRADYSKKITLKTIADLFRMHATYLGQLFLSETRMKFSEYLMLYRLLKAKELIERTDDKIVNIAERVGYSNINYFYTHFHSYYGISPTDMRGMAESAQKTFP